jgi:hypothetical protein
MICACMFPIAQLPGMFANVSANLATAASVSSSMSKSASMSLSASMKASMQAKAAVSAALSASVMAKLTATATAVASVQSALRVDLLSSSAPAAMNQLFQSMQANNLAGALGQLPVGALAQLKAIATVAAAAQARSSSSASQSAAMAASAATSAAGILNTQAAVKQAFGVNLTEAGSVAALSSAMATLNGNLAQMPNFGLLVSASLLGKASQLCDAVQAIKANLGVDLTQKGAGAKLNQALSAAAQSVQSAGTTSGQAASVQQSANLIDTSTVATSLVAQNLQGITLSQVPTHISLLAGLMGKLCGFGSDIVQHQPCGKQCLFALASLFSLFGCICPSASKSAGT